MKTSPTETFKIEAVHPGMHVVEGENVAEIVYIQPTPAGFKLDLHNANGTVTENKEYPAGAEVQVLS